MHLIDEEPLFDGEGLLHVVDLNVNAPSGRRPDELYSPEAIQFHRAQALFEIMDTFKTNFGQISDWEKRLMDGEDVKVKPVQLQPILGLKQHQSVHRLFTSIESTHSKWKVWRWKDIRTSVIIRFSQVVFHNYLAALE